MAQPSLHAVEGPSVARVPHVRVRSVDANVGRARSVSGHHSTASQRTVFVEGHDFSRAAKNEGFVSGHDFSRAVETLPISAL